MSIHEFTTKERKQADAAYELLSSLEAWNRTPPHHKENTPERMAKSMRQMTEREEFNFTTFSNIGEDRVDEMIVLGPIPFYTLCAHHVLPFYGNAWVGYIPGDTLAGLSKFARAVKWCAKGFWVQETLTEEIASMLESHLNPLGTAVVLKAEHMCMAMRGVEVAGTITTTSAMKGVFAMHNRTAKAEFLEFIK